MDAQPNGKAKEADDAAASAVTLRHVATLSSHQDKAWHLAWSPREPVLASCSTDKTVKLHRFVFQPRIPDSGNESAGQSEAADVSFQLKEVISTGHRRTVRQVGWSPSGRTLATASFDATVGIWERISDEDLIEAGVDVSDRQGQDQPEWDCIGTLEGHDSECKSAAFSRDGTLLASCSRDKSVWIWEVQPDSEFECLSVLMEHTQDVKCVAWHPKEELLASASYDDTIKLYLDDPSDDWYCYQTLSGHTSTVWSLAFSPCGNFLASASDDLTVRIWRKLTAEQAENQGLKVLGKQAGRKGDHWACTNIVKGYHTRTIYSVSWGRSKNDDPRHLGRIATGGGDGKIFVFDIAESEDTSKSLLPTVKVAARISEAHGVADVNCVSWAPASISRDDSKKFPDSLQAATGRDSSRFTEIEEEVDEQTKNRRAGGHPHMCDLLASAGDDGSLKVWTLPNSLLHART